MNNSARLENLMLHFALRRRDVAQLLGKPLNAAGGYSNSTVDQWLSDSHQVPEHVLELLELKLADRPQCPDPWHRLIRQPLPYADQRELEGDLALVLEQIAGGKLPRIGRISKALALQRAGYLLELIAQLGGPRFKPYRSRLLNEADRLRKRLKHRDQTEPLRADDPVHSETQDDLARKWSLTRGANIQRFRQLALAGHV